MFKFPPLTAESFIMLSLAIFIDLVSWLLLLCGLDDFGILDIIGTASIGTWLVFKKGKAPQKGGGGLGLLEPIKKIFTGKYTKLLVPIVIEIIPYLGTVSPTWFLSVYFNLI